MGKNHSTVRPIDFSTHFTVFYVCANIHIPCSTGTLRIPRPERFMRGAEPTVRLVRTRLTDLLSLTFQIVMA